MKRRDFLRATLVSAGSVLVGTGCGSDETSGNTREVLSGQTYFPQSVASGDPRPESVILWTRVEDAAQPDADLRLELEVALDEGFSQLVPVNGSTRLALTATAAFDHCVKVKVKGLSPATTYYYRFVYTVDGKLYGTKPGRARTAPAADADAKVRFAFFSCQDFNGRYYNSYLVAAKEELDFVVHLGDYIYETTGDPSFQDPSDTRKTSFTDLSGAIKLTSGTTMFYAAKSLSNYRELYRTYRSDKALQTIHEKWPMIVIWDDHEFANDCHGATATYLDEKQDEKDETRRKAANKAWFEYMPVDYADEDFVYDEGAAYPNDIRIYRDFTFGKHLHLVMTDLRSHRADHIISEGAYPGALILDQAALAQLKFPPEQAKPYLNIDDAAWAEYKALLVEAAEASGYDAAKITGNIVVDHIHAVIAQTKSPLLLIDAIEQAKMDRGFGYIHLAKTGLHSLLGSRYLVIKDTFDLYAAARFAETKGESETVMGAEQEAWFLQTMQDSTRTWKVWGNEYCLIPLQVDLTKVSPVEQFKQKFYVNVDAWDGSPNKRSEILEKLSAVGNVVAITGDIHAFYAGLPHVSGDLTKNIVEFVGSSVSSTTFQGELISQIKSDPVLSSLAGIELLAKSVDGLVTSADTKINPHLAYAKSDKNGFSVVEVGADELVVSFHQIAQTEVTTDYGVSPEKLSTKVNIERFKTVAGEKSLYKEQEDGSWKRWDPTAFAFV